MPVARIVTRHAPEESSALKEISEQLRASGYDVVIEPPGGTGVADLIVEIDELPAQEALDAALRLARVSDADIYLAPGLFAAAEAERTDVAPPVENRSESAGEPVVENTRAPEVHLTVESGGVLAGTLEELGAALADGRMGVRHTIEKMRVRAAQAWEELQQRREQAAQELHLQRERRAIEREQRRRDHEIELRRRAEEKQRLLAERERLAGERERMLREQMAREAAQRAEIAHVQEQERRRAAEEAESLRAAREQESQRAAALEAEHTRHRREQEMQPAAFADSAPSPSNLEMIPRIPAAEPQPATLKSAARARLYPRRRIATSRERHWQRAAFIVSIATLAAMLGFAIAGGMSPSSPLPASLQQNRAQQEIPFGAARMDVTPKSSPSAAASLQVNQATQSGTVRASAPKKPSAAKPAPYRARRGGSGDGHIVAEDEVVVRHLPSSRAQRAQTQRVATPGGVRRYSDEN